jgi:signal transduction histidine kinase
LQKDVLGLYYALIVFGFSLVFIYLENFGRTFYAFQLFFEDSDVVIFLAFTILPLGLYAFTNKYLRLKIYMPLIFKVQSVLLALIILLQIGNYVQNVINWNNFAPFHVYFDFFYYMLIAFASFLFVYFISSLVGHFRKIPYALTYFIAFSPFLLIALANSYQYANQGDNSVFQTNLMYIGFILTSVLFAIVWAKRHNEMKLKEVRADSLIKLNEAKTDFYSNITHEFRTPLTVIMGLANLIKDHPKEKELIQKNGQEVLNLVQQLLEISKAQSGALQLKLIDDNVILYLEYLIESFHPLAQEKNIDLGFYHDEEEIRKKRARTLCTCQRFLGGR